MLTLQAIHLNFALAADGALPDWVEVIPARPDGVDGRSWINDAPALVVREFERRGRPLPIDWEHATELRAPKGEPAPAAGWMEHLEVRDGAVWAQVGWTPAGQQSLKNREYRLLSPAFYADAQGRIRQLSSAALVNKSNFGLQLNRQQDGAMPAIPENITQALKLAADTDAEQVVSAILQLQTDRDLALNRANTPDLTLFVPRGDYDAALNRAAAAEKKLADLETAAKEQAIDALIQEALTAGKIAPATQDYYLAQCRQEGGLEAFKQFLAKQSPIVSSGETQLNRSQTHTALTPEETAVAKLFGHSSEDLKTYGQRETSSWQR